MRIGKRIAGLALGIGVLVGGAVVAAPAHAAPPAATASIVQTAASEWTLVSTSNYCYGGSWGQTCYTKKTYKRTSGFCAKPAGNLVGGLAAWYSYCYKEVVTTRPR